MAYFQSASLWVNRLADGVADLVLDVPGGKVNALTRSVLFHIDAALDRVAQDPSFRLLLVRSAKGASFCAGLALQDLADMTPEDFHEVSFQGQRLCDKVANLRLPSIAIISGGCLGGGLELAMACDYRVGIDKRTTIFGFPDLELGLIPTWGGTQRLPRLVGLKRALQMLLAGKRLLPLDAKAWGLVDEIADEGNPTPPGFLENPQKRPRIFLPHRTWRQKLIESAWLGRWLVFRGAERVLRSRLPEDMPAPWLALDAVRIGLRRGLDAGLARERAAAVELIATEACRNLVHLHLERNKLRTTSITVAGSQPSRALGIVGGGRTAAALIHLAVTKGFQVIVREGSDAALGHVLFGMLAIFQKDVARGAMAQSELTKNLARIHGTTAWKGFQDLDLVLEASDGDSGTKKALFQELERQTGAGAALVAIGPLALVSGLQKDMARPDRVAGLHFLAPASRSLLVEVVASDKTDARVTRRLADFVAGLGRAAQLVKDEPGFLIERILIPYVNEAILLVKDGLDPLRVDEAMARFGMVYGPLEYLDLMGLDEAASQVEALAPLLQPRLVLDGAFAFMVQQNWLGEKLGLGFYRYRKKKKQVNRELLAQLRLNRQDKGKTTLAPAGQLAAARQRLVLLTINEAAWCLAEGRAKTPEALDLALMLAGWAPHRGGPLHYAAHIGLDTVVTQLEELAAHLGPRFQPCPEMKRLPKTPAG